MRNKEVFFSVFCRNRLTLLFIAETIILWKEADFSGNIDYALSFQEAEGCSFIWNAINEVQNEYVQQREYGSVPSFARTQRITLQGENTDSSAAFTVVDENHLNIYSILPTDINMEGFLQQVKLKLESLHPSQRDYVSAQLLHDVRSFLFLSWFYCYCILLFFCFLSFFRTAVIFKICSEYLMNLRQKNKKKNY
jgi:hypothetical protein